MKKHWILPALPKKILAAAFCAMVFSGAVLAQNDGAQPIPCDGNAYLVKQTTANTTPVNVYSIDLNTGYETLYAGGLFGTTGATGRLNGIGYNITDGYIWGSGVGTNTMYRIGAGGNVDTFAIAPLTSGSNLDLPAVLLIGDVSPSGIYYGTTTGSSIIYRVDLNPSSPTYLQRLPNLTLSGDITSFSNILDFAFNPIDGQLYAFQGTNGNLYKIDPGTGVATLVYSTNPSTVPRDNYGAVYFDNAGNMYISNNTTGDIYRIQTQGSYSAVLFSTGGTPASNNDGARCTSACVKPKAGTDKSIASPQNTVTMDALPTNTAVWTQSPANPAPVTITSTSDATTTVTGFSVTGTYYFIWTVLGGCSDTVIITYTSVLPIELISFEATVNKDCKATVRWKVAMEKEVDRYELEIARASDPVFRPVYTLSNIANSDLEKEYSTWVQLSEGNNLLRLKTTDLDGSFTYSAVINIRCQSTGEPIISPNPATDYVMINNMKAGEKDIRINDAAGKLVYRISSTAISQQLSLKQLMPGLYFVSVINKNGNVSHCKLVKN